MDIDKLRRLSRKSEPMKAHTVRIPSELDYEIRGVCGKANLKFSVIFRQCVKLGWERIKEDSPEVRQLVEELR